LLVDEYDSFSNEYLEPYSIALWDGTIVEMTFKSFWATVKSLLGPTKGIQKVFITGISPLSLNDVASGFNVATNLSFNEVLSGLCGLTRADVEASLKEICGSDLGAYEHHISIMAKFFNGYHFCKNKPVEPLYNTETCLRYLQVRTHISLDVNI